MSLACWSFYCFLLSILVVRRVNDSTVAARLQKLPGQPQEKPYPHGDRKGPPAPTAPPSPLLYTSFATAASSLAWRFRLAIFVELRGSRLGRYWCLIIPQDP